MFSLMILRRTRVWFRRKFPAGFPHWGTDFLRLLSWVNFLEIVPTLCVSLCHPRHFYRRLPLILAGKKATIYKTPIKYLANVASLTVTLIPLSTAIDFNHSATDILRNLLLISISLPLVLPIAGLALIPPMWILEQATRMYPNVSLSHLPLKLNYSPIKFVLNRGYDLSKADLFFVLWSMFYFIIGFFIFSLVTLATLATLFILLLFLPSLIFDSVLFNPAVYSGLFAVTFGVAAVMFRFFVLDVYAIILANVTNIADEHVVELHASEAKIEVEQLLACFSGPLYIPAYWDTLVRLQIKVTMMSSVVRTYLGDLERYGPEGSAKSYCELASHHYASWFPLDEIKQRLPPEADRLDSVGIDDAVVTAVSSLFELIGDHA